jgi:hypothetical protein
MAQASGGEYPGAPSVAEHHHPGAGGDRLPAQQSGGCDQIGYRVDGDDAGLEVQRIAGSGGGGRRGGV